MTNSHRRNLLYVGLLFAGLHSAWLREGTPRALPPAQTFTYPDGSESALPYCRRYCTSWTTLRVGDGCVMVTGALGAGPFFFKLKRKMTANGPVFRVGGRTVTNFPDETVLTVGLVSGASCSKGQPPGAVTPSLEELKFARAEAAYIRDMKTHPLEISLSEEGNAPPPGAPPGVFNHAWNYRFLIKTKGVLLTDALVITLFSKGGEKFAQLTWRQ